MQFCEERPIPLWWSPMVSSGPVFAQQLFDRPTARQEITDQPKRILAGENLSVSSLGPTRHWCKRWSHVPRNLCPGARQLSLDRSLWQIPKFGPSQRPRAPSRHAAEMSSAKRATTVGRILAGAHRFPNCDTPLQGWGASPRVSPKRSIFPPLLSAHPKANESSGPVCAIASAQSCGQSWSAR